MGKFIFFGFYTGLEKLVRFFHICIFITKFYLGIFRIRKTSVLNLLWGIIFTNLCYTPQTNWYVRTVGFDSEYSKALLTTLMVESGAKDSWTNDIFSAISRISELPIGKIGYGVAVKDKKKATGIIRSKWENPVPEVILYSLFKFAEACDGYYQFSLSTLMDDSLERDGISPSRMFGLDRDTMIGLLNNLSTHYPEFIRASFTLDLETITLSEDKSAEDVLNLF